MRLLEGTLELLQLGRRERRSYPALLALLREVVVAAVGLVAEAACGTDRRFLVARLFDFFLGRLSSARFSFIISGVNKLDESCFYHGL